MREIYAKRLVGEGVLTAGRSREARRDFGTKLENEFEASRRLQAEQGGLAGRPLVRLLTQAEEGTRRGDTGVDIDTLQKSATALTEGAERLQRQHKNRAAA